jgi:hypothetical protein
LQFHYNGPALPLWLWHLSLHLCLQPGRFPSCTDVSQSQVFYLPWPMSTAYISVPLLFFRGPQTASMTTVPCSLHCRCCIVSSHPYPLSVQTGRFQRTTLWRETFSLSISRVLPWALRYLRGQVFSFVLFTSLSPLLATVCST